MKTFTQYLTESAQTYSYKIKVAGGCDADCIKELEEKLGRYDIIKMTEPKTTPVMEDPLDFPGVKNMEVCMFEVELNYPASQQELFQMIEACTRKPQSQIKIVTSAFADGWENNEGAEAEEAPLLEKDYPEETKEQKELKEKHAKPEDHIENPGDAKFEVAGGETPKAESTNDLPMGDKSPVGSTENKKPEPKSSAR
jgi:hypothetical protein